MKQKKKNRNIPPALSEGLFTLALGFAIMVIALFIAILTEIPFEVVCLFVFLVFIYISAVVLAIFHIKKKEKTEIYLANKPKPHILFDSALKEYLDGTLKVSLQCLGLDAIDIHVDLTDTDKCIDIQGRYKSHHLNVQLTETELAIGYSDTEPDPETVYLIDAETPYGFLLTKIREHIDFVR